MSKLATGVLARVGPSTRRTPVTHAVLPASDRLQRLHLAHVAAALDVGLPEVVGLHVGSGCTTRRLRSSRLAQLVDEPLRLGEQVLRVEQHDLDAGHGGRGDVHEHGILEAGGDDEPVDAVLLRRPSKRVGGLSAFERIGDGDQRHGGQFYH